MRKNRSLKFDEASSGSEDDSSVEEESSPSDSEEDIVERKVMRASADEEDDDESDYQDNDESSSHSDSNESAEDSEKKNDDESESSDDDDSEDDNDEEDLPLHERIHRKEQKGLAMQSIREKKANALKLASERLANLKRKKADSTEVTTKKKKSKHAPTEVSSKRSDFFRRGAPKLNQSGIGVDIGAHRYKPLDPRTSNLHGHLNEEQFEKNYAFLDDIRKKEISALKKRIAARKVTGKKGTTMRKRLNVVGGSLEEDKEKLKSLQQQKAEFERRRLGRTAKQAVKKKIRDDVAEGKRGVYFLKRKEKRRLEMEAKLEELRKRGGDKAVDKAIEKRRKKIKSRDATRFVK